MGTKLIKNPVKKFDYECRFHIFPPLYPPTMLGHDPVTLGDADFHIYAGFFYMKGPIFTRVSRYLPTSPNLINEKGEYNCFDLLTSMN
jgi:hypothetical protein